jgi:hypothetical protein
MLTPHEAHNTDLGRELPKRDTNGEAADRPLMDREVPLPGMAASNDPAVLAIHQWLDGDLSEADARRADAKQVALWSRISTETDQRRRMATPTHVAANIMAALPATASTTRVAADAAKAMSAVTSTTTSTAAVNHAAQAAGMSMPAVAAIGAALFAVGIAVGKLFL